MARSVRKLPRKARAWLSLDPSSSFWLGLAVFALFALKNCCVAVQCDWPPNAEDLSVHCVCGSGGNLRLAVHCGSVKLDTLTAALRTRPPLDLLSVSNSSLKSLDDSIFDGLDIRSLELTSLGLERVSELAFRGLERTLNSLSLEQNELRTVPTQALKKLGSLRELDLSRNRIVEIADGSFNGLLLNTLKLADNPLRISDGAFLGLENTLHNLNLKSSGQEQLPKAVRTISALSFLDLSQNKLTELEPGTFSDLSQLTALTLERNAIRSVDEKAFLGLNATLSSLSLLNNKIEEFPLQAIQFLAQIRVLDMGFNRIHSVPENAFSGNSLLSLLALDGNPLSTLSETTFSHLNSTMRGLSIGGPMLVCDCHLRWIIRWIKTYDLQVTSRERNPQFCGRPQSHRRRSLAHMSETELKCDESHTTTVPPTTTHTVVKSSVRMTLPTIKPTSALGARDLRAPRTALGQIRLLEVSRQGPDLTVKWDSVGEALRSRTAPPVHTMYRIFGEPHFHHGASVTPTLGWSRISVPDNKPIVVCVVESAQAATLSPESIPHSQCQEVLAERVSDSQLNKIIIGSSAAVCGMIVIAVLVFLCCTRRSSRRRKHQPPPRPSTLKSEHEWENASLYSSRSIPRARAYHQHGSVNPNFIHEPRVPADDVQSFRSLPPARMARGPLLSSKELRDSHIALSQLSGPHSFLGAYGDGGHNGWAGGHHWDNGDAYSDRHAPSRLSYAKDSNFG